MNFCKTTGCSFAACALAAALGACGGGFDDEDTVLMLGFSPTARPSIAAATPLLDDEGQPAAPAIEDHTRHGDERTRAGLYALRAQAQALDRALGGDVVWIDDRCCNDDFGVADAELALGMAAGVIAGRDLDANAPVFVALNDRRQGAALADRFAGAGYTRVFLVTD
jgi:hypothetical protein